MVRRLSVRGLSRLDRRRQHAVRTCMKTSKGPHPNAVAFPRERTYRFGRRALDGHPFAGGRHRQEGAGVGCGRRCCIGTRLWNSEA